MKRARPVVARAPAALPRPANTLAQTRRQGEAWQMLPGATYASAFNAMSAADSGAAAMAASKEASAAAAPVMIPAVALAAPASAQTDAPTLPRAIDAALQPVSLQQPQLALHGDLAMPTTSFGEIETQALRYAGGRCSEDIYRLAWGASDMFHIQPAFVAALIEAESGCRSDAVSVAGARGLMQLMPAAGAREGYRFMHGADRQPTLAELRDPAINIQLGVAYLGALQDHFYFVGSPTARLILVIAAYNCGPDFIDQRLPPDAADWDAEQAAHWVRRNTPAETRAFVVTVTEKAALFSSVAANARTGTVSGKKNLSP